MTEHDDRRTPDPGPQSLGALRKEAMAKAAPAAREKSSSVYAPARPSVPEPVPLERLYESDWLRLASPPLRGAVPEQRLLEANLIFDGGARFAVAVGDSRPRAVADVPFRRGAPLNGAIDGARRGVQDAIRFFCGPSEFGEAACANAGPERPRERSCSLRGEHAGSPDSQQQGRSEAEVLAEAAAQCAWSADIADGDGGLRVLLGEHRDGVEIDVVDGQLTLRSENLAGRLADERCRRALACYLLRVSDSLRMVRPVWWRASDSRETEGCGFELRLCAPPSAELLDESLGAMTAALGYCRSELSLLAGSTAAASAYLEHLGKQESSIRMDRAEAQTRPVESLEESAGGRLPESSSATPAV